MQVHRIFALVVALGSVITVVACGDDPAPAPAASPVTCGPGTTLQGTTCVAATTSPPDAGTGGTSGTIVPPDAGGTPIDAGGAITCGTGTVLSGSQCILPPAGLLKSARMTYLNVDYNLAKPVYLDNPIPIRFGITSTSADNAKPVTTRVNVLFSFVEANPADPAKPNSCITNGMMLDLVGSGVEQRFEAKIYPTSSDCKFLTAPTKMNLAVDFDRGLTAAKTPSGIDYPPVIFTAQNAEAPNNKLCKTKGGATGCVFDLDLQPARKGADGKQMVNATLEKVTPQSSVAVLASPVDDPAVPAGKKEDDLPAVTVDAVLVLEGRDPTRRKIDPATVPAEWLAKHPDFLEVLKFGDAGVDLDKLDDLPAGAGGAAPAVIRYDIVSKSKLSPSAWLPLKIDDPKNKDPEGLVDEIAVSEIEPGAETHLTHNLYLKGATLAAVTGAGAWAKDSEFIVRACLVANFDEAENEGDLDQDEAPIGGDVPKGDCKTFPVVLVKTGPQPTAASSESFNAQFPRQIGDRDTLALVGQLNTTNSLDLSGARSDTQAYVDLTGKIGSTFGVRLFNAYAKAGSTTQSATGPAAAYVDIGVEVLGNNVFGHQNNGANVSYTNDFKIAKQIEFASLGYGFGDFGLTITAGVGGEVGIAPTLTISGQNGGDLTVPELANATVSGAVDGTVEPRAILTGFVRGGIDIFLAGATVTATVSVIDVRTPLRAQLRWGVTEANGAAVSKMTVVGLVNWTLNLNWLNVTVDVAGRLGICFFCIEKTFNIFRFQNTPETFNLLFRQIGATVLQ